jgi:Helix-hairpin-helix domain
MEESIKELQKLTGVGAITAQRLIAAGLGTFTAIVTAGEEGLHAISGINPKSIPAILAEAATFADSTDFSEPETPASEPTDDLKILAAELRTTLQEIAQAVRERFPEELAGKIGHKVTRNMVAGIDALYALDESVERRPKRSRRTLEKVRKKLNGLAEAELTQIRKGLKQVRKNLERVIS